MSVVKAAPQPAATAVGALSDGGTPAGAGGRPCPGDGDGRLGAWSVINPRKIGNTGAKKRNVHRGVGRNDRPTRARRRFWLPSVSPWVWCGARRQGVPAP